MRRQGHGRPYSVLIAVLAAGALAPAAAQAGEAHIEGPAGNRTIVFTANPGEANSVLIDRDPGFTEDKYQLEDQDNDVTAGPGCVNKPHFPSGTEPNIVTCDPAGVKTIRILLGNGSLDTARFGNLNGNVITDIVDGGPGPDRITGSNGPSVITTGQGIDVVDARGGPDRINGGTENDDLIGGPGPDTVLGEAGDDRVRGYAQPGTHEIGIVTRYQGGVPNTLSGGPGKDTVEGDNGPDKLGGDAGNDILNGGGDRDVINGGAGSDRLDEGDDDDDPPTSETVGAPVRPDTLSGGAGKDTVAYCTRGGTDPIRISLDNKRNDGWQGEGDLVKGDIENALGGATSDDVIKGNGKANVLTGDCLTGEDDPGQNGNNKIFGLGGGDRLVGGFGNDTLNGGSGKDRFIGNEGIDNIKAKDGTKDKSINCDGAGDPFGQSDADKAKVDRNDPNPANCEIVSF